MTLDRRRPRPRVGVSACLLGQPVRYDATHRRHDPLIHLFGGDAEWITVCPEMELGLGAPREMIQLVGTAQAVRLITVETRRDITDAMRQWAEIRVDELVAAGLDGYVFKARSPSCGLGHVKVHRTVGAHTPFERTGLGMFAAALIARLPALPVAQESELDDEVTLRRFADAVFRYADARRAGAY